MIALHGTAVLDRIQHVDKLDITASSHPMKIRLGGIFNTARHLKKTGSQYLINTAIGIDPDGQLMRSMAITEGFKFISSPVAKTATAMILIDGSGDKMSVVDWGDAGGAQFLPIRADWHHLMYLEHMDITIGEIKMLRGTGYVSADLCSSTLDHTCRDRVLSLIREVDYLIVSDNEARSLSQKQDLKAAAWWLSDLTKQFTAIVHTPKKTYFAQDHMIKELSTKGYTEAPRNVLGAGDVFAAEFLINMTHSEDIIAACRHAMESATHYIQNPRNEI
jgi:sugar/nucleoside kinase (ribokinase family)